jgi:hypothetical protein
MRFSLISYNEIYKSDWNKVISQADNGHFMIFREYLEYHADRFIDHSFLIKKENIVVGVIPGNLKGTTWYTHQGLTFGGIFLLPTFSRSFFYKEIFSLLWEELKKVGVKKVEYKCVPHIYHRNPSEGEIYFLNQLDPGNLIAELSTTLDLQSPAPKPSALRIRGMKKAIAESCVVQEVTEYEKFWSLMNQRLEQKYNKQPTHSLEEIEKLHKLFPKNIRLFTVLHPREGICAGTVIYENDHTSHAQYIASNNKGLSCGALDMLFFHLINMYRAQNFRYFDFGISTEKKGAYLNEGLVQFKEGFGGGTILYLIKNIEI